MRTHLPPKKRLRWFVGAAVAASAMAIMGLVPAASAQTAARTGLTTAGSASAAAAPSASTCHWFPVPAEVFVGDPEALYPSISGRYDTPGTRGVAYKITGPFPHSTTLSFTSYNQIFDLPGSNYLINDNQIIPDSGSVNPFVPGTRVEGTPRDYTVYAWPEGVPVPPGLKNVFLFPTNAVIPGSPLATFFVTMRMYHMQPGYSALAAMRATTVTAMSAATLAPVRCPLLPPALETPRQVAGVLAHIRVAGPIGVAPEPTTGHKIYFTRYPGPMAIGPEGYPADGCVNYVMGTLPKNQISVVTQHAVPEYFNNDLVTPASIMKDYQVRYESETIGYWPEYDAISVNTDDAVYTPDGTWVTVYLPGDPRLPASEIAQVRAVAQALDWNVIQVPPNPESRPIARLLPYPVVIFRNKGISSSFPNSVTSVPCWATPENYRDYPYQTSPAFFAKYASSSRNMGSYHINGVKLTFAQFMGEFSN
jgi:hypothetical protein